MRTVTLLSVIALLFLVLGCKPMPQPKPELQPVTGTITHKGQPVKAGGLILMSQAKEPSSLVVNANIVNGAFTLETTRMNANGTTETWPGAPAGTYQAVFHPISNGATTGLEVTFEEKVTIAVGEANTLSFTLPDELPKGEGAQRKPD